MTARTVSPLFSVPDDVRNRIRADLHTAATHRQQQLEVLLASSVEAGTEVDPVVAAQRATLRQLIEQITAAQTRIDDDTFGQCERCQGPIPLERLEVRPWTSTCVACAKS